MGNPFVGKDLRLQGLQEALHPWVYELCMHDVLGRSSRFYPGDDEYLHPSVHVDPPYIPVTCTSKPMTSTSKDTVVWLARRVGDATEYASYEHGRGRPTEPRTEAALVEHVLLHGIDFMPRSREAARGRIAETDIPPHLRELVGRLTAAWPMPGVKPAATRYGGHVAAPVVARVTAEGAFRRISAAEELEAACQQLGASRLFAACIAGRGPIPVERDADVGEWVTKHEFSSGNAWIGAAKRRPLLFLAGTCCDFVTLDLLETAPAVRSWDHEEGYNDLPARMAPTEWLQKACEAYVENDLVRDLEAESGEDDAPVWPVVEPLVARIEALCDPTELVAWRAWLPSQWWYTER